MPTTDDDKIIRDYFKSLGKPKPKAAPVDVVKATRTIADPVARLRKMAELRTEQASDSDPTTEAFIAVLPKWAKANGVTRADLRALGVPNAVLREAGLATTKGTKSKSTRVGVDDVLSHSAVTRVRKGSAVTVSAIAEATGASTSTVRNALESAKWRKKADPNHDGRGRAPMLYTKP